MWRESSDECTYKFGLTKKAENVTKPDEKKTSKNPTKPNGRRGEVNFGGKPKPVVSGCRNLLAKSEIDRLRDAIFCVESGDDLSGGSDEVDLSLSDGRHPSCGSGNLEWKNPTKKEETFFTTRQSRRR